MSLAAARRSPESPAPSAASAAALAAPHAGPHPALQALYAELAARDRELAELRARLAGLRASPFDAGDPCAGERRPFDVMAAIEAALRATRAELAGTIVSLRVHPLPVFGSLAAVTQVLVHLLANAGAAMHGTGRHGVIHIDAATAGPRARIRVSDNGHGIAPERLARLCEPFFSSAGSGLGRGLGLTVSSAIVRAHGGVLSACNRQPHGARFAFDLPLAPGARRDALAAPRTHAPRAAAHPRTETTP